VHTPRCSIRSLWRAVESAVRDVMEGITLADLSRDEDQLLWIDSPAEPRKEEAQ
jgi:DNA-binding IscR family transcriptional regulator